MKKLTKYTERLYEFGLSNLKAQQKDTAIERKSLRQACRDVDRWRSLCSESSELYESTLCTEYPSAAWKTLLQLDKQICSLTVRLLKNARRYGWTPLARSILKLWVVVVNPPKEEDPLESILSANERRMKKPILEADPMEEVLTAHESKAGLRETSL